MRCARLGLPCALFRRFYQLNSTDNDARSKVNVHFYQRLEEILERAGWKRDQAQTQREFATSLGERWKDLSLDEHCMRWVDEIITAFYRVRFGGATLDKEELDAIEHALSQLDTSLDGFEKQLEASRQSS